MQNGAATAGEQSGSASEGRAGLAYDAAAPLLGTWPRELKTYVPPETCTLAFKAALSAIAKEQKQLKCASRMNGKVRDGISTQWSSTRPSKGTGYQSMLQRG